jgi:hypothetical protein
MADFSPYLISSLPMLHFGMKPPFSFGQFLEACRGFMPEKDYQVLSTLPQPEQYSDDAGRHPVVGRWVQFDSALRNELVKIRAGRKHVDPAAYLHQDGYTGPSLAPFAAAANMGPSLLESEKSLDEARWRMLDEIATAHYFDVDALITYAYKLLILQRWENIRSAKSTILLEGALEHQGG